MSCIECLFLGPLSFVRSQLRELQWQNVKWRSSIRVIVWWIKMHAMLKTGRSRKALGVAEEDELPPTPGKEKNESIMARCISCNETNKHAENHLNEFKKIITDFDEVDL